MLYNKIIKRELQKLRKEEKMIFIFCILMAMLFVRLSVFSIRFSWTVAKILFSLILLPLSLVGLVLAGAVRIALPVLAVIGLISLIAEPARY